MSSSDDTPILIESDNDSDVEILHEEKNADLDIIFVSETIHVKDEDKDLSEKTKPDCNQDVGFNRSLSISSNLDVSLQLNDTTLPVAGSSSCNPCCDLLRPQAGSVIHDNVPLNLSTSNAKYDDISESSGEESTDSEESASDCDSVSTPKYTRSPVLSMPVVFQCDDQLSDSMKTVKPLSFSTHNVSLGTNSSHDNSTSCLSLRKDAVDKHLPSVHNKVTCNSSYLQSSNSIVVYPDQGDRNSKGQAELHRNHVAQNQQLFSNNTSCLSNQNSNSAGASLLNDLGRSSSSNDPSTSSQSKSLEEVFDELVQDLDFLSGPVKHQTLSKSASVSFDQCSSAPSGVKPQGIKRTLSDQNFKSKHDDKILPPKKQTRYLQHQDSVEGSDSSSWRSEKCSQCLRLLLGVKLSRCVQGHPSCTTCLEEKVKVVLTGKIKESLHCLKLGCDSYFPLSELNQSLPKMVVDILETKLDEDHVDYIHNMLLKNASADATAPNTTTEDVPSVPESKVNSRRDSTQDSNRNVPENWTEMDKKKVYELHIIEPGSPEYISVAMKFHESMQFPSTDIVKVSRIQNPILWQYFSVKRSEMIQENEGIDVEERKLFHGTQTAVVEPICKKGFDWRVCGKNGTVYGQGSYFAVNASYSHQYTDNGCRRNRGPSQRPFLPFQPPPAHTGRAFPQKQPFQLSSKNWLSSKCKTTLGPGQPPAFVLNSVNPVPFFPSFQINSNTGTIGSANQQGSNQNSSIIQQGPGQNLNISQQAPSQNLNNNAQGPGQIPQLAPNVSLGTNQQTVGHSSQQNIQLQTFIINAQPIGQPQLGQPLVFNQNQPCYIPPEPQKPLHKMILSRVLVGKWTGGQASLRKPPPLFPDEDLSGRCYDSCVDNIHDPKIFVIFDSAQAYPEYLIEYHST